MYWQRLCPGLVYFCFISLCSIYVFMCFLWFVPPSSHFCSLAAGCFPGCRSAPWVMTRSAILWSSAPKPLYSLTTSPECRYPLSLPPPPQKHRFCLQAFNAQLLCLLVLQFSPSPSPLQVLFICPVSSPTPAQIYPLPVYCGFALCQTSGHG